MRIDVNTFIGNYPFRELHHHAPTDLLRAMDRCDIDQAWISNLPALFWRDPSPGNTLLFEVAAAEPRLLPVPTIHPELPGWQTLVADAQRRGAPALRAAPHLTGTTPAGPEMRALVTACGATGMPLIMAVRLEDGRQRHPIDASTELSAATIRSLIRSDAGFRLIVTHADREIIEQVHFGATPEESQRILWDISWIWGPPEDHLELLLNTVGRERFTFGTGMPLRLPENAVAKMDLLRDPAAGAAALGSANLLNFLTSAER